MIVPFPYDPRKHQVLEPAPQCLVFLRGRHHGHADKLLVYRHLWEDILVVAEWHPRKGGRKWLADLCHIGPTLGDFDSRCVQEVDHALLLVSNQEANLKGYDTMQKGQEKAKDEEAEQIQDELLDVKTTLYNRMSKKHGGVLGPFWNDVRLHRDAKSGKMRKTRLLKVGPPGGDVDFSKNRVVIPAGR